MTDSGRSSPDPLDPSVVASTRHRCPCCGYLTLPERGGHCTCPLCGWDDDGQDDPHADEVWGGLFHYSLTQGRTNFRDHLNQYNADDPMAEPYSVRETEAKRTMIATFKAMGDDISAERYDELWRRVLASEQVLREELTKMIFDKEWMRKRGEKLWAYWERLHGTVWVQKRLEQIARSRERMDTARAKRERIREPELQ